MWLGGHDTVEQVELNHGSCKVLHVSACSPRHADGYGKVLTSQCDSQVTAAFPEARLGALIANEDFAVGWVCMLSVPPRCAWISCRQRRASTCANKCTGDPRLLVNQRRKELDDKSSLIESVTCESLALLEPARNATMSGGVAAGKLAQELLQLSEYGKAALKLQEAISLEADPLFNVRHRVNLGVAFNKLGKSESARQVLEDALRRIEELSTFSSIPELIALGCFAHINLFCVREDSKAARRAHLERALHLNASSVEALNFMADFLEKEDDALSALPYVQKSLSLAPQGLFGLGILCRCLERLGRHTEALHACIKICRLDVASIYAALKEVFLCRKDDVFVCTYPRCGTTWMVQVIVCLLYGPRKNYNDHAVFLEGQIASDPSSLLDIEAMPAPRIMKTHAPSDIFPGLARNSESELQPEGKTVIVVRNPKDVLVSLRHHHQNNKSIAWDGSWDEWVSEWLKGNRSKEYGGTYFEHVKNWWRLHRNHPHRIHLTYFEDLKAEFKTAVAGIAAFLGQEVSSADLELIEEHCTFENMKSSFKVDDDVKNKINPIHFRQGEVSGWRRVLTEAQALEVDRATWLHLREEIAEGLRIYDLGTEL